MLPRFFNVFLTCCNKFQYAREMSHPTIYSVFFEWIEGRRLSAFMKNSVKNMTKRSPPRSVFAARFVPFRHRFSKHFLHTFLPKIHPENELFSERILGWPFERIFIPNVKFTTVLKPFGPPSPAGRDPGGIFPGVV